MSSKILKLVTKYKKIKQTILLSFLFAILCKLNSFNILLILKMSLLILLLLFKIG